MDAMGMQVLQGGVVAVAVEGIFGRPLDEDQYLARLNTPSGGLTKPAKGHHAAAVSLDLAGRATRIGQVLFSRD